MDDDGKEEADEEEGGAVDEGDVGIDVDEEERRGGGIFGVEKEITPRPFVLDEAAVENVVAIESMRDCLLDPGRGRIANGELDEPDAERCE